MFVSDKICVTSFWQRMSQPSSVALLAELCRWFSNRLMKSMVDPSNFLSSSLPNSSIVRQPTKRCQHVSIREFLKIIAQILVPLMIGTFTVVIALQQHNLAKENRKKDLEIAQQLREQQFTLDEQRRAQELALDEARRTQDLAIADNQQRDAVFNAYIRDLSNLLLISDYVLTRPMLDSIVRPMTLTILRQLDPGRKALLLKFLYESKMIRTDWQETRLDLTDADLHGIALDQQTMKNLSLVGASLINASFLSMDLTKSEFDGADLTDASFVDVDLSKVSFYRSRLTRVRFNQSRLTLADLDLSDLQHSTLNEDQFQESLSHNMAILPDGSEAPSRNLIYIKHRCSLTSWEVQPRNAVNVTQKCHFVASKENSTLTYSISLIFYQRLIEHEQALFEFRFLTSRVDPRVTFIYTTDDEREEIRRGKHFLLPSWNSCWYFSVARRSNDCWPRWRRFDAAVWNDCEISSQCFLSASPAPSQSRRDLHEFLFLSSTFRLSSLSAFLLNRRASRVFSFFIWK